MTPQARLAKLLADWTAGQLSLEEIGKTLLDIAFDLGLPAMFLRDYLTAQGAKQGDAIADVAEEAKLAAQALNAGKQP